MIDIVSESKAICRLKIKSAAFSHWKVVYIHV